MPRSRDRIGALIVADGVGQQDLARLARSRHDPLATVSASCSSYWQPHRPGRRSGRWRWRCCRLAAEVKSAWPALVGHRPSNAAAIRIIPTGASVRVVRRRGQGLAGREEPVIRRVQSGRGGSLAISRERPLVVAERGSAESSILEVKQHRGAENHAYPSRGPSGQKNRYLGRQAEGKAR